MKFFRFLGRFLIYFGALWVAAVVGWGLICLAHGGSLQDEYLLHVATSNWFWASFPCAVVFAIAIRKREKRARPLLIVGAGWAFFAALATQALASYPPLPRLQFLDGHQRLFSANPGTFGTLWDIYSFPASPPVLIESARKELLAMGLESRPGSKKWTAEFWLPAPADDLYSNWAVHISPGRTTGKYWVIDGHFLISDEDEDWVTVEVFRADPIPFELRRMVEFSD